jgi:hypothetical protein
MTGKNGTHEAERNARRILLGSQTERDHVEYLNIGERIMLKYIVEEYDGVVWVGLIWLGIRSDPLSTVMSCRVPYKIGNYLSS